MMKIYRFESQLWLPQPRSRVFDFFADPGNLERLTPSWLHFEIVTGPETEARQGTLIDYRLRLRGIPLRWQSVIDLWEPPDRFVDRQIRGPYSLWIHEHTFQERDRGTVVGDKVEYAVPGGGLVQRFFVAPDLERIFQHRHRILEEIFDPTRQAAAQ